MSLNRHIAVTPLASKWTCNVLDTMYTKRLETFFHHHNRLVLLLWKLSDQIVLLVVGRAFV
jgi:hypothetical protein